MEWSNYEWMNGQPWGEAHPNKDVIWYADKDETYTDRQGSLVLNINNNQKYFGGDVNHVKKYGCGCVSTYTSFLYGHFHFEYILPIGIHLFPAIWLSGFDNWPPEIDIVEGWSGDGYFKQGQPNYKKFLGFNRIHPSVYYGKDSQGNVLGKGYGSLCTSNVTFQWYQQLGGKINTCDLYWNKDRVVVYYNGHVVMDIQDETILRGLRERMYVCIDFAVNDNFTEDDYSWYLKNGSPMVVKKFEYKKQ